MTEQDDKPGVGRITFDSTAKPAPWDEYFGSQGGKTQVVIPGEPKEPPPDVLTLILEELRKMNAKLDQLNNRAVT
jgi:hypothetical protein